MEYSKPKVTIDLEEYNELLELQANFDKKLAEQNEGVYPYKQALSGLIESLTGHVTKERIIESVRMKDVVIHISSINGHFVEVHCKMKQVNGQN